MICADQNQKKIFNHFWVFIRITVLMPTKNEVEYIEKTILSLLQNLTNNEIDGRMSTDENLEKLNEIKDIVC